MGGPLIIGGGGAGGGVGWQPDDLAPDLPPLVMLFELDRLVWPRAWTVVGSGVFTARLDADVLVVRTVTSRGQVPLTETDTFPPGFADQWSYRVDTQTLYVKLDT